MLRLKFLIFVLFLSSSCERTSKELTVSTVIDSVVTRIYANDLVVNFKEANQAEILSFLTDTERSVLAHDFWKFNISEESNVYVFRDTNQTEVPFWLIDNGFSRLEEFAENERVTYEIWSKTFPKGEVKLGINGFDRHRFSYFVAVKPTDNKKNLQLTPVFPVKQEIHTLTKGSFTYHDWDELTLNRVPEAVEGALLLPTNRGRSREAHLIGAFRITDFPSSTNMDQIIQTWTADTKNSLHIAWRTSVETTKSEIKYWKIGSTDTLTAQAVVDVHEDRMLANDRFVHRHRVLLNNLEQGSYYAYRLQSPSAQSDIYHFSTDSGGDNFSFGWFGDLHNNQDWGNRIKAVDSLYDDVKFYLQVGDLVNTGMFRDHWDKLWGYSAPVFANKPFMAVPGNHDSQEGLLPVLYQEYLPYPPNGPDFMSPGLSYTFNYGNTEFFMLDCVGESVESQKTWLEEQLRNSQALFKIAVFHFPPFTPNGDYPDIVEHWVPLFEKYGVDLIFNGHYHYYLRTKAPKHKTDDKESPTYVMSIGIADSNDEGGVPSDTQYAVFQGYLFQKVSVNGRVLEMIAYNEKEQEIDKLIINKN